MRLIDADELENIYRGWLPQLTREEDAGDRNGVETCIAVLQDAPTIDAVPVVRCKDCRYCDPENKHCDHPMGTLAPFPRKDDDFCSYAKRKGGDER